MSNFKYNFRIKNHNLTNNDTFVINLFNEFSNLLDFELIGYDNFEKEVVKADRFTLVKIQYVVVRNEKDNDEDNCFLITTKDNQFKCIELKITSESEVADCNELPVLFRYKGLDF